MSGGIMMFRLVTKSAVVVLLILSMLITAPLVYAEKMYTKDVAEEVSGEDMILDLVLLRPLGFVATVLGAAAFVVSLPFTIPLQQKNEAAQKMVVKPGKYTFTRPLGYENK
jgi:hypothetical protein